MTTTVAGDEMPQDPFSRDEVNNIIWDSDIALLPLLPESHEVSSFGLWDNTIKSIEDMH